MLIPRFSIRTLLLMLTIVRRGVFDRGNGGSRTTLGVGASIGIFSLAFTLLVHAAWFGVIWLFSQLTPAREKEPARVNKP